MKPIDPSLKDLFRKILLLVFDFDGVFTDNTVYVSENGSESVRCWRGDGIGLRKLDSLGIATIIISTETNPVVSARAQKLLIRCLQGIEDKRAALEAITQEMRIPLTRVAYMGNDINDLACLQAVGLPIGVQDSHPDILPFVSYRTHAPGGHGAVREICDLFERIYAEGPLQLRQ